MRALHSILHSVGVWNLFFKYRNFTFPFNFVQCLETIGSPDNVSETKPRYFTCECCRIFIFLYLTFSFPELLILCLLAKRINFTPPKCMPSLLSRNESQIISKFLFICFSIFLGIFLMVHEAWVKNRFDFTAWDNGLKMKSCGTSMIPYCKPLPKPLYALVQNPSASIFFDRILGLLCQKHFVDHLKSFQFLNLHQNLLESDQLRMLYAD